MEIFIMKCLKKPEPLDIHFSNIFYHYLAEKIKKIIKDFIFRPKIFLFSVKNKIFFMKKFKLCKQNLYRLKHT